MSIAFLFQAIRKLNTLSFPASQLLLTRQKSPWNYKLATYEFYTLSHSPHERQIQTNKLPIDVIDPYTSTTKSGNVRNIKYKAVVDFLIE